MTKSIRNFLVLIVLMLLIHTASAVKYSPAEVMSAIQPHLTAANVINPTTPMIQSQEMNGKVNIYQLPTNPFVYVYTSSASIDCDGQATLKCTGSTDPYYQGQTSFTQSDGKPLNAELLPWYVLPETPNPIFDYTKLDISGGEAGLVIYNGNMEFGVFGDERGRDDGNREGRAIGEISYAMAESVGIDPDPENGGTESGVTYLVFTGQENVVTPIESHDQADISGQSALEIMMDQLGASTQESPV